MESNPSALPAAPPVVAVVVCTDPGTWFEDCLSSLAAQDYPNLSVLVIDTASQIDPTPRVAEDLPRAFVRRSSATTFGAAANEVLELVEGASLYLFCHDDVALSPDVVRILVEEAYRSNAGIVGPKLVEWDDPSRLLAVGVSADRFGVVHPLVEPGELDQEQHDAVRDVFLVPSGATLVRSDLFEALGGFDPAIDQIGEDLDLCWRAQVAGARVVVAPGARVRHVQAQVGGRRAGWEGTAGELRAARLREGHRLRSDLICYGLLRLAWLVPAAGLSVLGEAIVQFVRGNHDRGRMLMGALIGALRRPRSLWRARWRIQRQRAVPDRDLHRLQSRGNARLRALLRTGFASSDPGADLGSDEADALAVGVEDDPHGIPLTEPLPPGVGSYPGSAAGADAEEKAGSGLDAGVRARTRIALAGWQAAVSVALALGVVLLIGSRSLLGHAIPDTGQLPFGGGSLGSWWHQWWSPWRPQGLGGVAAASPALGLMALGGTVAFGALGALQHAVVLGPLVVGPWGIWRVTRRLGSTRARLVAVGVYAVVPVPYNALAQGRWGGVIMYAAAPWIVAAVSKAGGETPFARVEPGRRALVFDILRLGLLVALVGAFVPVAVVVVPIVGLALYAGCALTGRPSVGVRGVQVGVGAAVVAVVALLPWSVATFGSVSSLFGTSGGPASRLGLGRVLRFDTGPVGNSWLAWAFIVAAALALVLGGSWRLRWAARWWVLALVCWTLTWMGLRGWLPVPVANPEVLLAPAAVALALSAGMGAAAFELDLPEYRFGWRQFASAVAGVAVVLSALPMLRAVGDGHWNLPTADAASALPPAGLAASEFRVLWIGAPSAIPGASWRLSEGVGYTTSLGSGPLLGNVWLPGAAGSASLLASDIRLAEHNETTELGHLLASMAVRYVVIPDATAPSGSGGHPVPTPAAVLAGLQLQTDMQPLITDPNYTIYQNAAWAPAATTLSLAAATAAAQPGPAGAVSRLRPLQSLQLQGSPGVLPDALQGHASGSIPAGTVYVAVGGSGHLRLEVNGQKITAHNAFGWASSFAVPVAGHAQLSVSTPVILRLAQILEILVVVAGATVIVIEGRRRRRSPQAHEPTDLEVEMARRTEVSATAALRRRPVAAPVGGFDEDMWADG